MPSGRYYEYTVRDRETREVICQGSRGKCADFIGCAGLTLKTMAVKNKNPTRGFFNSRYEVTREPKTARGRKHYRVYKGDRLIVEGSSWVCANALGLTLNLWYQLVTRCSIQPNPEYIITTEFV